MQDGSGKFSSSGVIFMRNRIILVAPLVGGLLLAGSAAARMLPAQTVRDGVYQQCVHNGVSFNKQGHANCGLHLGWSNHQTAGGDESSGDAAVATTASDAGTTRVKHDSGTGHGAKAHTHTRGGGHNPKHGATRPSHASGSHGGKAKGHHKTH
jgi:hypothetical protein